MKRTTQLAAATLTAGGILTGSWFLTNAQAAPVRDSCTRAIALADEIAEVSDDRIATTAARSIALRLEMTEKAGSLDVKRDALTAEYDRLRQQFRDAANKCR